MKIVYLLFIVLFCFSCNNTNIFKGQESIITQFPETIRLKGKNINLEIIGINNLYIIDTFLMAYTGCVKIDTSSDWFYCICRVVNLFKINDKIFF